jgi:DNA repair exonuclease SbcCD nuclease subunit
MIITIFGDLHIHNYKKFDDGNNSRLYNCLDVLDDIFLENSNYGIENILFLGDLYDNQKLLPSLVVNKTIERFAKLFNQYPEQRIYAITGNHDQATKNLINSPAVTALEHIAIIFPNNFILLDNKSIQLDDTYIYGIPYYEYPEQYKLALKEINALAKVNKDNGYINILMIHQTPNGLGNPNIPYDTDVNDGLYKPFDYIFCGHIHQSQQILNNFLVAGNPLQRDLGDEGQEKGFWVLNTEYITETKGLSFVSRKGKYPEFIRREVKPGEVIDNKDETNYIIPVIKADVNLANNNVSTEDFGSDLKAETILTNFWKTVDGKNNDLLATGLELIKN